MSDELGQMPAEVIDADAVCAQCGTVNREGVFICRTCGNNLRDQRAMRLVAEQVMDRGSEGMDRRRFLTVALTMLGILAILWTMLNVNQITDWLIAIHTPSLGPSDKVWNDSALNDLAADLRSQDLDEDDLESALESPGNGEGFDGVFVLASTSNSLRGKRPIGSVLLRNQDGHLIFVAQLQEDAEIRGYATIRENQIVVEADAAAARYNGRTFAVFGVAVPQEDGGYECVGQSEVETDTYSVVAYRMPS